MRVAVLIAALAFPLLLSSCLAATVETYEVPAGAPKSDRFSVRVNGKSSGVYATPQGLAFTIFSFAGGAARVDITCKADVKQAVVRPLSAGVKPAVKGKTLSFTLDGPKKLSVEVNKSLYLMVFADPSEKDVPDRADANVVWYGPGYHDLGKKNLRLTSGQTLYISGGAYLDRGRSIIIRDARNVTVRGRGVIVGNTRVYASRNVDIEGIVIHPAHRSWMNKIDASQRVTYRNVKAVNGNDRVPNFDGFDVMSGCHHILIEDVFVRGTDDCLSVKHHPSSPGYWTSKAPISHVTLRNAVLWNVKWGTTFRIGPETIGPSIERVTLKDVDIIHTSNGFEILAVDGVWMRNILIEDIRVEHYTRNLLSFDMRNWYHIGPRKGHADGIYLRDLDVRGGIRGWKIQGADADHAFRNVFLDELRVDGVLMTDAAASLPRRIAHGAIFRPGKVTCGGVARKGFFVHPPYKGATGQTVGTFKLTLPDRKSLLLKMSTGIKDGAGKTNGVRVAVEVGDSPVAARTVGKADGWTELQADLSAYRNRTVTLHLVVDALGDSSFDWAAIGEPRVMSGDTTLMRLREQKVTPWIKTSRKGRWGAGAVYGTDARPPADRVPTDVVDCAAAVTAPDGRAARVYVVFSEPVTRESAEDVHNYAISGDVRVEKARRDYHFRQVILSTSPIPANGAHTLSVNGVRDLAGNAAAGVVRPLRRKPAWKASGGYASFQGKFGWWYEQFNPQKLHIYPNRRDIVRSPRYWLMNYYPPPDGGQWLAHRADTGITRTGMTAGATYRAVRTWMAPADGTVRVTGSARAAGRAPRGRVQIVYNATGTRFAGDDAVVWKWQTLKVTPAEHDVTVDVKAHGVLRFIADDGAVEWDPEIRYVP